MPNKSREKGGERSWGRRFLFPQNHMIHHKPQHDAILRTMSLKKKLIGASCFTPEQEK